MANPGSTRTAVTEGNGVQRQHTPLSGGSALTSFKRVLIVGAGGFGREVLLWARDAWAGDAELIAGFLSENAQLLATHDCDLPIVGNPATFEPRFGDALLLGIGIPGVRRKVAEDLLSRGAEFLSLVHPTAVVAPTASIGLGSIICPNAIVSDSARLGRFALVNYHASLAHDSSAGEFTVLSPYATLAGGARITDDVFLGLHASIGPGVEVGPRSKVAANSSALSDVPADSLVVGVPGRISPLLT